MSEAVLDKYVIIGGGPLRRLEHALHIAQDDAKDLSRRVALAIVLGYGPLLAAGSLQRLSIGQWPMLLRETSTHVRVLVVLPLLLLAEAVMDLRSEVTGGYLLSSGLVGKTQVDALKAEIARTARLRDSTLFELALAIVTVATVVAYPAFTRDLSLEDRWALQPGVFLTRFLVLRLLWRWMVWGIYLRRLVALPIELRVTHPDRVGGASPLAGPTVGFAFAIMGITSTIAATWGDEMRFDGLDPKTLLPTVAVFAGVAFAVAFAPMAPFTTLLMRLRWRGVEAYSAMANQVADAFQRKWFHMPGGDALEQQDVSTLNDLGGAFERVENVHLYVAPRPVMAVIGASIAAPLLPLVVHEVGAAALLARIAHALI